MKIGIVNFDTVPAAINQLLHIILPELLKKHNVTGIEIDHYEGEVEYKSFTEEDVKESRNLSKRLLRSSSIMAADMYKLFLQFDAVIAIGKSDSLQIIEKLMPLVDKTHFLLVPVSIYNDIEGSEITLGYDSAINSIVESILKIRDTIDSLKYSKPRLFGVEIPGDTPNQMGLDIALAVEGYYYSQTIDTQQVKKIEEDLQTCFQNGQTYSFIIFNETIQPYIHPKNVFPSLDVEWKVNKIDEALCIGQSPTAMDRILAVKLAKQVIDWTSRDLKTGILVIHSGLAIFKEMGA